MYAPHRHQARVCATPWQGLFGTHIDSDRHFGKHAHATFGFGLIERGAQSSASGRGKVQAGAGDVITTNPGEVHDGRPMGDAPRRWQMVYVDPQAWADLMDAPGHINAARLELTRPVIHDTRIAARVVRLFDALGEWRRIKAVGHDAVMHDALALASLACDEAMIHASYMLFEQAAKPREHRNVPPGIRRVRDRIADDLLAAPSLSEMAATSGLSRYQLLRRFEAAYGLPPHRWLIQRRVEMAQGLIHRGASLANAAADSGFADQSHLHRHFTRHFGFTPGAWQRAALQ